MVVAAYAFHPGDTPEQVIARSVSNQLDSFTQEVGAGNVDLPESELQRRFLRARLAYKKIEWAAEYFTPAVARLINGEPVPEAEPVVEENPVDGPPRVLVIQPEGLQVIEGILFPHYDTARKKELRERLERLQTNSAECKRYFDNIEVLRWQVFDAAKLEVFRVMTLGIAGFDERSIDESAAALQGLGEAMKNYGDDSLFRAAVAYLHKHPDFNSFDRAHFITAYGNPLSAAITREDHPVIRYNRLLRQDAATLFDKDAFNADAYAPTPTTAEKIALGKRLFFDPTLSGPQTRSCASCHQPDKTFADGLAKNTVIGTNESLPRNTPTLINCALQPAQFYDLRALSLEDQARDVLENPKEMQGSLAEIARRLDGDTVYRRLFSTAFPEGGKKTFPETGKIDTLEIVSALASYVRSLVNLNSRFDSYMRGDSTALNQEEIRGFNLFMGKARCGTCHYMPLFNGVFPPLYDRMETEVLGPTGPNDTDAGRFNQVPVAFMLHSFKTTTVRNAAHTAPYMHDGVFSTLEAVMDFYNKGGGHAENQTLSTDSLHLDASETKAVIAFIKSLDSR